MPYTHLCWEYPGIKEILNILMNKHWIVDFINNTFRTGSTFYVYVPAIVRTG